MSYLKSPGSSPLADIPPVWLTVRSVKPGEKPLVVSREGRSRLVLCIIHDNFIQNLYKVYGNQIKYQNIKILTTTNGPDIAWINTRGGWGWGWQLVVI